jgi:hypothetical protein
MGNSSGGVVRADVTVVTGGTPSFRAAVRASPATARNVRGAIACATRAPSRQEPRNTTVIALKTRLTAIFYRRKKLQSAQRLREDVQPGSF